MRNGTSARAKSNRVRVWWPPTDDQKRSGYSGMYWPADVLTQRGDRVQVQYDNGDKETVNAEDLQPGSPPVAFGGETRPLQVGEFVEVSNDSETDPAEWVGVIKAVKPTAYTVSYPFHNSGDEDVKESLIRRARVWDIHLGCWLCVQPLQEWSDGEVTSPVELCLCTDKELTALLVELRQSGGARRAPPPSPPPKPQPPQQPEPPPAPPPPRSPDRQQSPAAGGGRKRRRAPRDPAAPKPPQTAYLRFSALHRAEAKAALGADATPQAVTRRLAELWAAAPADEKAELQAAAEADRARFAEEMKDYVPPPPAPAGGSGDEGGGGDPPGEAGSPPKRKRAPKDKDAPKRPLTAYILFTKDFRKGMDKAVDFTAATTLAAQAWQAADKETRERYVTLASCEREAYKARMKVYSQQKGAQAGGAEEARAGGGAGGQAGATEEA